MADDKGKNNFGKNFKEIRKMKGLKQEDLVGAIGVTQQSIDRVESGNIRNPKNINKYAEALGVTVDFLFNATPSQIRNLGVYSTSQVDVSAPAGFLPVLNLQDLLLPEDKLETMKDKAEKIPMFDRRELSYMAVRMDSDSMQNESGVSIEKDAVVIFDPDAEPVTNCIVVVNVKSENRICIRTYISEGGTRLLKAANNTYLPMHITGDCEIMGVVKEKRVKY